MRDALRTSAGDERLGWVDSMRGGAALSVGLFHATVFLYLNAVDERVLAGGASAYDLLWSTLLLPARYGYVGFAMFFIVSGFAIHYPVALGAVRFDFRTFIARRFVRLYLPFAASIALALAVASFVKTEPPIDVVQIVKSLLFVSNYPHPGGPHFEIFRLGPQQNFVIWTVSAEFELYFTYPLLRRACTRFGPMPVLSAILLVSLVTATIWTFAGSPAGEPPNWVSWIPAFTVLWYLWAMGVVLAEARARGSFPRWNWRWKAGTIVLAGVILFARPMGVPLLYDIYLATTLCAMLFIRFAIEPAGFAARFVMEALRRFGRISYSYYLTQVPTYYVVGNLAVWYWQTKHYASPLPILIAVVAAIPVSYVFFRAVERPSTLLARSVGKRLSAALGVTG